MTIPLVVPPNSPAFIDRIANLPFTKRRVYTYFSTIFQPWKWSSLPQRTIIICIPWAKCWSHKQIYQPTATRLFSVRWNVFCNLVSCHSRGTPMLRAYTGIPLHKTERETVGAESDAAQDDKGIRKERKQRAQIPFRVLGSVGII